MIYYVLYELLYNHFKEKDWFLIKALNVFQYVTFRTAYASITALLLSLVFGGRLIRALKSWNVGQQIREEGPQGHKAKHGTPTMGGVLIIGSVVISTLLWAKPSSVYVWTVVIATLLFGIGLPTTTTRWRSSTVSALPAGKVAGAVGNRNRRVGRPVRPNKVFCESLFMECQHSLYQSDRSPQRHQLYRTVSVSNFHHRRSSGVFKWCESD